MEDNLYCRKRKKPYIINHYKYNHLTQPELYYFSLLMLFKPWRSIDELKGNKDTYTHAFLDIQNELIKAYEYHDKFKKIQEAIDKASKLVQDQELANTLSNLSNNPENCCDPLDPEQVIKDIQDMIEKDVGNEINIDESIAKFNADQMRIFNKITTSILSDNKVLRMFVSGFGGTGKSFVIENLVSWNKIKLGKNIAVAAPTGIAAYNIHGLTVHRLFQLPVEHSGTAKYKSLSDNALKQIRLSLKDVNLIIIDEVSMISNITLMYIHLRLTEIFCTSECEDGWFGRIHIVLFGDLLQLPPVRETFPFIAMTKSQTEKYIQGMVTFNLWSLFDYDELTINMRQKNDKTYSEILARIRLGFVTSSDITALKERKIIFKGNKPSILLEELCQYLNELPDNTVCLMPTKNMCKLLNDAMLHKIESEDINLVAKDCYKCPKRLEKKVLKILNEDDETSCGISRIITIKIGCRVMIRRNVDVSLGLVNGTIGTVIAVNKGNAGIDSVVLRLQSNHEYSIKRMEYKFAIMDQIFITREQFPFSLSYAITIHKSQGLSLENAVVEGGNNIFSCGQMYVALSRITKLEGLHLINFDPSAIKADDSAIRESNRLRNQYRKDLPCFNICTESKSEKVFDDIWSISKQVLKIQANYVDRIIECPLSNFILILPNKNSLPSYTNSCIQSLFHCHLVRKGLLQSKENNHLIQVFN